MDTYAYPDGQYRKTLADIQGLQFATEETPLHDNHRGRVIGKVVNKQLAHDRWVGDIVFTKALLTPEELHQLLTLQKKELSIGFSYTPLDDRQTDILVEEVSWTEAGRCGSACALDSTRAHTYEVIPMTEELQKEIALLKEELGKYRQQEKDSLIADIVKRSTYQAEELKKLDICALRAMSGVLQKAKDSVEAEITDKPKTFEYKTSGTNDLFKLYEFIQKEKK